jgi:tetratricopeptide (TPR) repeat protein
MGRLFEKEGRVEEAGEIYKKSLSAAESSVTAERPNRALSLPVYLDPLVVLYRKENRLSELETILRQALDLGEHSFGPDSANLLSTLTELAMVCRDEGKYPDAIQFFQRGLQMDEKAYGPESTQLPPLLLQYADLLQKTNQPEEAEAAIKRATALREKLQRKKSATPDQTSKN